MKTHLTPISLHSHPFLSLGVEWVNFYGAPAGSGWHVGPPSGLHAGPWGENHLRTLPPAPPLGPEIPVVPRPLGSSFQGLH